MAAEELSGRPAGGGAVEELSGRVAGGLSGVTAEDLRGVGAGGLGCVATEELSWRAKRCEDSIAVDDEGSVKEGYTLRTAKFFHFL